MVAVANLANLASLAIGWQRSERWQAVPIMDAGNPWRLAGGVEREKPFVSLE